MANVDDILKKYDEGKDNKDPKDTELADSKPIPLTVDALLTEDERKEDHNLTKLASLTQAHSIKGGDKAKEYGINQVRFGQNPYNDKNFATKQGYVEQVAKGSAGIVLNAAAGFINGTDYDVPDMYRMMVGQEARYGSWISHFSKSLQNLAHSDSLKVYQSGVFGSFDYWVNMTEQAAYTAGLIGETFAEQALLSAITEFSFGGTAAYQAYRASSSGKKIALAAAAFGSIKGMQEGYQNGVETYEGTYQKLREAGKSDREAHLIAAKAAHQGYVLEVGPLMLLNALQFGFMGKMAGVERAVGKGAAKAAVSGAERGAALLSKANPFTKGAMQGVKSGLGSGIETISEVLFKNIKNHYVKKAVEYGTATVSEMFEEGLQTYISKYATHTQLDKANVRNEVDYWDQEMLDSVLLGGIFGGVSHGVGKYFEKKRANKRQETFREEILGFTEDIKRKHAGNLKAIDEARASKNPIAIAKAERNATETLTLAALKLDSITQGTAAFDAHISNMELALHAIESEDADAMQAFGITNKEQEALVKDLYPTLIKEAHELRNNIMHEYSNNFKHFGIAAAIAKYKSQLSYNTELKTVIEAQIDDLLNNNKKTHVSTAYRSLSEAGKKKLHLEAEKQALARTIARAQKKKGFKPDHVKVEREEMNRIDNELEEIKRDVTKEDNDNIQHINNNLKTLELSRHKRRVQSVQGEIDRANHGIERWTNEKNKKEYVKKEVNKHIERANSEKKTRKAKKEAKKWGLSKLFAKKIKKKEKENRKKKLENNKKKKNKRRWFNKTKKKERNAETGKVETPEPEIVEADEASHVVVEEPEVEEMSTGTPTPKAPVSSDKDDEEKKKISFNNYIETDTTSEEYLEGKPSTQLFLAGAEIDEELMIGILTENQDALIELIEGKKEPKNRLENVLVEAYNGHSGVKTLIDTQILENKKKEAQPEISKKIEELVDKIDKAREELDTIEKRQKELREKEDLSKKEKKELDGLTNKIAELSDKITGLENEKRVTGIFEEAEEIFGGELPFQISDKEATDIMERENADLEATLYNLLRELGFSFESITKMLNEQGIDVIGAVNLISKVVYLSQDRNIGTLPEETGHIISYLLSGTKNMKYLFDNIHNWSEYEKIKKEYGEIYKGDEKKIRFEAVGKLLSKHIVGEFKNKQDKNWFQRTIAKVKNALKRMFRPKHIETIMHAKARAVALDVLAGKADKFKGKAISHEYAQLFFQKNDQSKKYNEAVKSGKIEKLHTLLDSYFNKQGILAPSKEDIDGILDELFKNMPLDFKNIISKNYRESKTKSIKERLKDTIQEINNQLGNPDLENNNKSIDEKLDRLSQKDTKLTGGEHNAGKRHTKKIKNKEGMYEVDVEELFYSPHLDNIRMLLPGEMEKGTKLILKADPDNLMPVSFEDVPDGNGGTKRVGKSFKETYGDYDSSKAEHRNMVPVKAYVVVNGIVSKKAAFLVHDISWFNEKNTKNVKASIKATSKLREALAEGDSITAEVTRKSIGTFETYKERRALSEIFGEENKDDVRIAYVNMAGEFVNMDTDKALNEEEGLYPTVEELEKMLDRDDISGGVFEVRKSSVKGEHMIFPLRKKSIATSEAYGTVLALLQARYFGDTTLRNYFPSHIFADVFSFETYLNHFIRITPNFIDTSIITDDQPSHKIGNFLLNKMDSIRVGDEAYGAPFMISFRGTLYYGWGGRKMGGNRASEYTKDIIALGEKYKGQAVPYKEMLKVLNKYGIKAMNKSANSLFEFADFLEIGTKEEDEKGRKSVAVGIMQGRDVPYFPKFNIDREEGRLDFDDNIDYQDYKMNNLTSKTVGYKVRTSDGSSHIITDVHNNVVFRSTVVSKEEKAEKKAETITKTEGDEVITAVDNKINNILEEEEKQDEYIEDEVISNDNIMPTVLGNLLSDIGIFEVIEDGENTYYSNKETQEKYERQSSLTSRLIYGETDKTISKAAAKGIAVGRFYDALARDIFSHKEVDKLSKYKEEAEKNIGDHQFKFNITDKQFGTIIKQMLEIRDSLVKQGYSFVADGIIPSAEYTEAEKKETGMFGLAGEVDLIAYKNGEVIILDFKNMVTKGSNAKDSTIMNKGGSKYQDWARQLTVYKILFENLGIKINKVGIIPFVTSYVEFESEIIFENSKKLSGVQSKKGTLSKNIIDVEVDKDFENDVKGRIKKKVRSVEDMHPEFELTEFEQKIAALYSEIELNLFGEKEFLKKAKKDGEEGVHNQIKEFFPTITREDYESFNFLKQIAAAVLENIELSENEIIETSVFLLRRNEALQKDFENSDYYKQKRAEYYSSLTRRYIRRYHTNPLTPEQEKALLDKDYSVDISRTKKNKYWEYRKRESRIFSDTYKEYVKELNSNPEVRKNNKTFIDKVIKFFKEFISDKARVLSLYEQEAMNILKSVAKGEVYVPEGKIKKGFIKLDFVDVVDKSELAQHILLNMHKYGASLTGSLAYAPFGNVYRIAENVLHDIDTVTSLSKEDAHTKFMETFPEAIHMYDVPKNKMLSYIVPLPGHEIKNIERRGGNMTLVTYYEVFKDGQRVGTFTLEYDDSSGKIENRNEIKKGVEATYVDIFYESNETADDLSIDYHGTSIPLNHYLNGFGAKLGIAREKDTNDLSLFRDDLFRQAKEKHNQIINEEMRNNDSTRDEAIKALLDIYNQLSGGKLLGQAHVSEEDRSGKVLINAEHRLNDTLPHEYAHHYIAWHRNTAIVQEGIKRFGSEEALVQAIGEAAYEKRGEAWTWWKKFTEFVKDKFRNLSKQSKEDIVNTLTEGFLQKADLGEIESDIAKADTKEIGKQVDHAQKKGVGGLRGKLSRGKKKSKFSKKAKEEELKKRLAELEKKKNNPKGENEEPGLGPLEYLVSKEIEEAEEKKKECEGWGTPKAKDGMKSAAFTPGSKWTVVKDLKGHPSHAKGGVDVEIGSGGVSFTRGEGRIKAAHGLVISGDHGGPVENPSKEYFDLLNTIHSDKLWVERGLNPDKYPYIINKDKSRTTHKLVYSQNDLGYNVYPTVRYDKESKKLIELSDENWDAWKSAVKNKDFITFKTEAMAKAYSKNGLIDHTKHEAKPIDDFMDNRNDIKPQ